MMTTTSELLTGCLRDVCALEEEALGRLTLASGVADPAWATVIDDHRVETTERLGALRSILDARGRDGTAVESSDVDGFATFARAQRDGPGELGTLTLWFEALEWAAYDLLEQLGSRARDTEVVEIARAIRSQEAAIMRRIESLLPRTAAASMDGQSQAELRDLVLDELLDAHAIELQAIELLRSGRQIADDGGFSSLLAEHVTAEREHERALWKRLAELNGHPTASVDATRLQARAFGWHALRTRPEGTARYAAYLFAVQYLEIGAYEQIRRVAERADDSETHEMASRILREERTAADRLTLYVERSVGRRELNGRGSDAHA